MFIESFHFEKMADWLRKLNASPLGSARVVSNVIFVMHPIGCMVKWLALLTLNSAFQVKFSVDPSILKISASICRENLVKTKLLKKDFQVVRCLGGLVSFRNITLSIAHENVESYSHLLRSGSNRRICA